MPETLPPAHEHLQYGYASSQNYSVWSTSGSGGSNTTGGAAGICGSYVVRHCGTSDAEIIDSRINGIYYGTDKGVELSAGDGGYLSGGSGAGGKEGGGGGGGGYFGGGGGGSGELTHLVYVIACCNSRLAYAI